MGTPDFAVPALASLHDAGHEIVCVYTQPPRPAGRGKALRPSPVQVEAERRGLPVRSPVRVRRDVAEHEAFANLNADAAVVAAYGLLLPKAMLDAPKLGCLNIHASLLPRWRGASPIHAAVLAGDARSGVSIMRMDEGLDTGDVLAEAAVDLSADETAQSLHDRLGPLGAALITQVLSGPLPEAKPQPEQGATYASKLTRETGHIDWTRDAHMIERQVRGLTPWPGTFTTLEGDVLKIGGVSVVSGTHDAPPGTVLDDALLVACGEDKLRLERLQRPGRAMMDRATFLRGSTLPKGARLGE
jgi:methionyl-tRNA formyltransferase